MDRWRLKSRVVATFETRREIVPLLKIGLWKLEVEFFRIRFQRFA